MFKIMTGQGFSMTFANGSKVEVDFGPLSRSDNSSISKQAFAAQGGECANAEVRIYEPGDVQPGFVHYNVEPGELINILETFLGGDGS